MALGRLFLTRSILQTNVAQIESIIITIEPILSRIESVFLTESILRTVESNVAQIESILITIESRFWRRTQHIFEINNFETNGLLYTAADDVGLAARLVAGA